MLPPIALGVGILVGAGAVAVLDRFYNPLNYVEAFVCSISVVALATIGCFWGGFSAGTALAGGILATLLTIHELNNLTTKLAVRIAFIVIFGGIGLGFQQVFI